MSSPVLSVSDLCVSYGTQTVLQDVSFDVNANDVVIIVGPNGSGKSTLLKALLGTVAYSGTVTWHTKKVGYLPPQQAILRTNIPPLTVGNFFSFKSTSVSAITAMLDEVGLPKSILTEEFATLSTGQFQRMMLAWVLIDAPEVLLLDEPTAGIDIAGQETVYSLLHALWKKRNLTLLLVTHDVSFVWKHATSVLCLNTRLLCYGPPEKTLTPEILKKMYGTEVSLYEHRHSLSD